MSSSSARTIGVAALLSIALAVVGVLAAKERSATVQCPPTYDKLPLTAVDVYDGPPSEQASLVPAPGGWDLNHPSASNKGFYLGCVYEGARHIKSIELPSSIKSCTTANYPQVVCQ